MAKDAESGLSRNETLSKLIFYKISFHFKKKSHGQTCLEILLSNQVENSLPAVFISVTHLRREVTQIGSGPAEANWE